jgi:hypothetical protein
MKTLLAATAVVLALGSSDHTPPKPQTDGPKLAATCFNSGEQISGMNKICFYNCLGSGAAITIGATELCPLSIEN